MEPKMAPPEMTGEQWDEILGRFSRKTRLTACLTTNEAVQIRCVGQRCALCEAIRREKQSLIFVCSQTASTMTAMVNKTLHVETELCQVGLVRVVVPLVRQGRVIQQISACGAATEEEEPDFFLISRQLGISEPAAKNLAASTPEVSEENIRQIALELFEDLNPTPIDYESPVT